MTKTEREIISYREIGDEVNPLNMTHKEFVNYLCHRFGFRIVDDWDGIERRHYRPNLASFSAFAIILVWFLVIIYFNYIRG